MIRFPSTIFVATAPLDLRLSFDRLAGFVREQLGADPRSEALFIFHNRARTHLKMMWHDGSGYCVFYKRLDRGGYRIPLAIPAGARSVTVSAREMAILLEGINEATLRAARRAVRGSARAARVEGESGATERTAAPAA
jgi:transposase